MEQYELYHHGVMGMKWGVRRYQNKDRSLTGDADGGGKGYALEKVDESKLDLEVPTLFYFYSCILQPIL